MNDQNAITKSQTGARMEILADHPATPTASSPGICARSPTGTVEPPAPALAELDQLVTAERLRQVVWDPASRPSLQWIRKETKRRMLPHIRRGRLIFYRPRSVVEWYAQRESRPATMK